MKASPISSSWLVVFDYLNETQQRLYAAEKAIELGRGGIQRVHEATHLHRETIKKGIRELTEPGALPDPTRVRPEGGGRKKLEVIDPAIEAALEGLLEGDTAGLPTSHLRWTHKSLRRVAKELTRLGHPIGPDTVGRLLQVHHFSSQVNAKTKGHSHPDRDAQFRLINRIVAAFMRRGDPVISVDAKKREKIGDFKNPGTTLRRSKNPRRVNTYDWPNLATGLAIPHGTLDLARNEGFVNVGMTHETSAFAVHSIREWWRLRGRRHYPNAKSLLICADSGGSNGIRNRGWKFHLQEFANDIGMPIRVCHYPQGTSKWNKIEHKMFSFITMNWQGTPLETYELVINLIGGTRTETGLRVKARLDRHDYPTGEEIMDDEMASIHIEHHGQHPAWNYTVSPDRGEGHGR